VATSFVASRVVLSSVELVLISQNSTVTFKVRTHDAALIVL
jgi:hypothetical protein